MIPLTSKRHRIFWCFWWNFVRKSDFLLSLGVSSCPQIDRACLQVCGLCETRLDLSNEKKSVKNTSVHMLVWNFYGFFSRIWRETCVFPNDQNEPHYIYRVLHKTHTCRHVRLICGPDDTPKLKRKSDLRTKFHQKHQKIRWCFDVRGIISFTRLVKMVVSMFFV